VARLAQILLRSGVATGSTRNYAECDGRPRPANSKHFLRLISL